MPPTDTAVQVTDTATLIALVSFVVSALYTLAVWSLLSSRIDFCHMRLDLHLEEIASLHRQIRILAKLCNVDEQTLCDIDDESDDECSS